MSEKRRGLGRGLGALIPTAPDHDRPVDVFFPDRSHEQADSGQESSTMLSDTARELLQAPPRKRTKAGAGPGKQRPQNVSRETTPDLVPVPGAHFAELPVTDISPNPRQPRTNFDEGELGELVGSIKEIGVLQPIVVRPVGAGKYELIMGERRLRATQEAGLAVIPAIVRDTDDQDLLRDALLENLHRSALNPLEEAAAYRQLLDDFDCTHEVLAARISRSRPQISNTLRLLNLPPVVQRRVAVGVLSAGHARALLGLNEGSAIEDLAARIVAEGLSVRATEEIVSLHTDRPAVKRTARHAVRNETTEAIALGLSDRFDTRVRVAMGKSKGKMTVEFATLEDLNRILAMMGPEISEIPKHG